MNNAKDGNQVPPRGPAATLQHLVAAGEVRDQVPITRMFRLRTCRPGGLDTVGFTSIAPSSIWPTPDRIGAATTRSETPPVHLAWETSARPVHAELEGSRARVFAARTQADGNAGLGITRIGSAPSHRVAMMCGVCPIGRIECRRRNATDQRAIGNRQAQLPPCTWSSCARMLDLSSAGLCARGPVEGLSKREIMRCLKRVRWPSRSTAYSTAPRCLTSMRRPGIAIHLDRLRQPLPRRRCAPVDRIGRRLLR